MTDDFDLDAIKARVEAASPGPWWSNAEVISLPLGDHFIDCSDCNIAGGMKPDDAYFAALARTDVPALIAEVERLREAWESGEEDRRVAEATAAVERRKRLEAETCATAAEAKLAEAERRIERLLVTQRRLFEGDHVRLLEEAEAKLADLASAIMEEVEPTLGERMRCVRLARAALDDGGEPDHQT